jgi:uncharacterized damage-inducible protein DinB
LAYWSIRAGQATVEQEFIRKMNQETQPTSALAFYEGWETYQNLLIQALAPLTAEQLAWRPAPHLRSIQQNCLHIIGARARWCSLVLRLDDESLVTLGEWDSKGMPERSATELVSGLQQSWQVLRDALQSWTPADLFVTIPTTDPDPDLQESYTRQWVIWHLVEHDLNHGGEISLILGMNGLEGLGL